MTKLSVNVNKIATLRNARGHDIPNVLQVSSDIIRFGAHGITVHPRPDERHIKKMDVITLRQFITPPVEFNVEGYPSEEFLKLIKEHRPDQVTLVPDPPDVITSNAGWNIASNFEFLKNVLETLTEANIRVSLFVDPKDMDKAQFEALEALKPHRIELYTERFARELERAVSDYKSTAEKVRQYGIGVNAGHDLSLENLTLLLTNIPFIDEVSIGHALICEALYLGLEETIHRYLKILEVTRVP